MGVGGEVWRRGQGPLTKAHRPLLHMILPRILVVAGEASGDDHAARLVAAIRESCPRRTFFGIGGEAMAAQGVRILTPASKLAVVGLLEVAGHLPAIWQALRGIGRVLKTTPPDLAILVDFPDFNFWVARLAKYYRVPVLYYISPQVWAWRTYRVRTLARLTDRLVVIFPFEADFYRAPRRGGVLRGPPLSGDPAAPDDRRTFLLGHNLDPEALTIALLPGSRAGEIERHLPIILKAAQFIHQAIPRPSSSCPWPPPPRGRELVESGVAGPGKTHGDGAEFERPAGPHGLTLKVITGQAYQALGAAHVAVVASGTATVEAALAGMPTVIVYRVSPLTFAVARRLVRVDHVGMANLLAGERVFPELLQDDFTPARLAQEVLSLIQDPERLWRCVGAWPR